MINPEKLTLLTAEMQKEGWKITPPSTGGNEWVLESMGEKHALSTNSFNFIERLWSTMLKNRLDAVRQAWFLADIFANDAVSLGEKWLHGVKDSSTEQEIDTLIQKAIKSCNLPFNFEIKKENLNWPLYMQVQHHDKRQMVLTLMAKRVQKNLNKNLPGSTHSPSPPNKRHL